MGAPRDRAHARRRRIVVGLTVATAVAAIAVAATTIGASQRTVATRPVSDTAPTRRATPSTTTTTAVYAHDTTVRPDIAGDLPRVYVPSGGADRVEVIDPATKKIVSGFSTGRGSTPQHIVPSYDLKTLWVLLNKSDHVIPITAATGAVGAPIAVNDPYNLYFTPDGSSAIVVAELHSRLDFRDPHTMALQQSVTVPGCRGLNHADYSADGRSLLVTCEFAGSIAKVDMTTRKVVGTLALPTPPGRTPVMATMPDHSTAMSMPQDIRLSPDGTKFYVADMLQGGLHVIDGAHLREIGFIPTGVGAHSVTPSHDGTRLYVANRGWATLQAGPHGAGSVSVVDPTTDTVVGTWSIPGGGSPDMGNLTADGRELWLSGRYDSEVYVFDTATGALAARIPVPRGPHGLTVWPLAGRYSLGHTGNMR